MTFKDFAGAVVKHSVKTAKEIGKTVAVAALAEVLDVPITTGTRPTPPRPEPICRLDDYRMDLYPKSNLELAIDTVLNAALMSDFDSEREKMAKKILKIGMDGNSDLRAYAIAMKTAGSILFIFQNIRKNSTSAGIR